MEPNQEKGGDAADRISNLPDAILHYILKLSGLKIFDLVELGILSKRWNNLWITMPYLDIDTKRFFDSSLVGVPFDHALSDNLTSFIYYVLLRQGQSRLVQFRLFSRARGLFDYVEILTWLHAVARRHVEELDIEYLPIGGFKVPLFIAVNDSLIVLRIALVNHVVQLPSVVRLNRLRSLELYQIEFTDSDLLQRLFSGCGSLESLRLKDCVARTFNFLDFSSTHLKELIFGFNQADDFSNFEIKVSCPNLVVLEYSAHVPKNYILENVSSLKTASIGLYGVYLDIDRQVGQLARGILKELHNVTNLHLDMNVVYSLSYVLDELTCQPTSFPKVKSLSLLRTTHNNFKQVMFLLLDHCPNLEVFTLISEEFEDEERDDEPLELQYEGIVSWKSHPHLKTMKFDGFKGSDIELDLLRFILKNARSLEKFDIIWCRGADILEDIIEKVLMFPKASSGTVVRFNRGDIQPLADMIDDLTISF